MTTALTVGIESTVAVVVGNNPFSKATVADWIAFCDVQPTTQATYNKAIENFVGYLISNKISAPTRQDVINYREGLLALGYKVSTARLYLTIVKKFFRWLSSKMIYPNVAEGIKLPAMQNDEHARDALTLEESKMAISTFKGKDEKSLRDKAIMSLMIGCGLRSIEIVRLDVGDIEKRRGQWFIKVHGKARAGKTDSVALSNSLKKILDDYLQSRAGVKKNSPMFISTSRRNRGARLETQSVSRLAKRVFLTIGIESERITCHSCRHTAALTMLMNNVSLLKIQMILRHKQISTTQIYLNHLDRLNNDGEEVAAAAIL